MNTNILTLLFYKGKHHEKEEKDNLTAMLLPLILGIIFCAVCLMGSTWAWFTATQSTGTQIIQAANYTVDVEILSEDGTTVATSNTVTLQKGRYTIKLTANGDATTGYCVLDFGNDIKAYTEQIAKGAAITLLLNMNEPATLEITAVWGTYAGKDTIAAEYTYATVSTAEEETPNDSNSGTPDATKPTEEATPPMDETQPTEEGTEPPKTEDNNVPSTELEVTAPPETAGDTDTSEIKTEE